MKQICHVCNYNLHLILEFLHVSFLHEFVKRHELAEALRYWHDLRLSAEIHAEIQSFIQKNLLNAETY